MTHSFRPKFPWRELLYLLGALLSLWLLALRQVRAQSVFGAIRGMVNDDKGAVIAGLAARRAMHAGAGCERRGLPERAALHGQDELTII